MLRGGGVVGRMVERGRVVERGKVGERVKVRMRKWMVEVERMVRVVRLGVEMGMLGLEGEGIGNRSRCLCSVSWRQVLYM